MQSLHVTKPPAYLVLITVQLNAGDCYSRCGNMDQVALQILVKVTILMLASNQSHVSETVGPLHISICQFISTLFNQFCTFYIADPVS